MEGISEEEIRRTRHLWGNSDFAAPDEFLLAIWEAFRETKGPVLELGSGVSTVVLNELNATEKRKVWSFESDQRWRAQLKTKAVDVLLLPLVDGWYDLSLIPDEVKDVGLLIIDGPCGERSGVANIFDRLAKGCVVLIDDAIRESAMIGRLFPNATINAKGRGIARVTL